MKTLVDIGFREEEMNPYDDFPIKVTNGKHFFVVDYSQYYCGGYFLAISPKSIKPAEKAIKICIDDLNESQEYQFFANFNKELTRTQHDRMKKLGFTKLHHFLYVYFGGTNVSER